MTNPQKPFFSKIRRWIPGRVSRADIPVAKSSDELQNWNYETLGPTAVQVAKFRACSDIPFARELAREINADSQPGELELGHDEFVRKASVVFEARFKGINAILEGYPKIKNFIEIPAGFSTRGMEMVRKNRDITYIECDFAPVIQAKKNLAASLLNHAAIDPRNGLVFQAADILHEDDMLRINRMLPRGAVALITEGLLNYFSREDKVRAAQNIHRILSARGGVWVVTDLTFLFPPSDPDARKLRAHIASVTGFNPAGGFFISISQAKRFFESQGFRVQEHSRAQITDRLSTAAAMDSNTVAALLEFQVSFALEV
jgi:O-methyltransferase involved in polyketide biosynthesis